MDKETYEKLIADQPKEIRGKAVVLFNAAAECALAYQEDHSTANLRNWEAAEAALTRFINQLGIEPDADTPIDSLAGVLEYLKREGWPR